MRIAYYAPLKAPDHPVPSGDRLMARQLDAALRAGGHAVTLASDLRSYCGDPDDYAHAGTIRRAADTERRRIAAGWADAGRAEAGWADAGRAEAGPPDLWVSYHPYAKSPDLIGPPLCARFAVPYVTIETSYSARRNLGVWRDSQAAVLAGIAGAVVNICLTARDRAGILAAAPAAVVADLPPFIDPAPFQGPRRTAEGPVRLITVAMMRAGDKRASYGVLAAALERLPDADWRLTVVGSGPQEAEVRALFAAITPERITWAGLCARDRVADLLRASDLYLWPGQGEAYGLAYLEAQAAGLPVVAQDVAGVPEVVARDLTGVLTAPGTQAGDVAEYAAAIDRLITDRAARCRMGQAAQVRVLARHSFVAAVARLRHILLDIREAQR